jgi:hypothetical protein
MQRKSPMNESEDTKKVYWQSTSTITICPCPCSFFLSVKLATEAFLPSNNRHSNDTTAGSFPPLEQEVQASKPSQVYYTHPPPIVQINA